MWLLAELLSKDVVKTGMFLAGVLLLIMILLRRFYRYYGRRKPTRKVAEPYLAHTPRPTGEKRSLSNASADVLSWHVEMHETAREMKAELDSKMRALQLLIGQARYEADRLEQILGRFESTDALPDAQPSRPSTSWLPGSPDRQAEIFALADQGRSAAEIAEQIGTPLGEIELILSLRGTR